jgi:hypothetical protein
MVRHVLKKCQGITPGGFSNPFDPSSMQGLLLNVCPDINTFVVDAHFPSYFFPSIGL